MVALVSPVLGAATAVLAFASGRNMWQTYSIRHADQTKRASFIGDVSTQQDVLNKLESMPKGDLLKLFLSSNKPPASEESIQGEWNGILLRNNLVLTTVTKFLTNGLFGKGRKWNGKAFYDNGQGINRFHAKTDSYITQTEHRFDYKIAPSKLDPKLSSVSLSYKIRFLFGKQWWTN